jgi:hypothetical protein
MTSFAHVHFNQFMQREQHNLHSNVQRSPAAAVRHWQTHRCHLHVPSQQAAGEHCMKRVLLLPCYKDIQQSECAYDATLSNFHETTVAVENISMCECACVRVHGCPGVYMCVRSVALLIRHGSTVLSLVASMTPPYFSTLSHNGNDFREKIMEHKMHVPIFPRTFIWNNFHYKNNFARYCHKCENSSCKVTATLVRL